jgi:DNA topoisomerase VI subunit B
MENDPRCRKNETIQEYHARRMAYHTEHNDTLYKRRQMTEEQKRRGAIDKMARDFHEKAAMVGREQTFESARAEAQRICEKAFNRADASK